MAGLRAFETQMPYQKYQGPPIVVGLYIAFVISIWPSKVFAIWDCIHLNDLYLK